MGRGRLTQEEIDELSRNKFVVAVKDNRIIYTNEFKHRFMKEYNGGKGPTQIFRDAGFNTEVLGAKRIERASARWRESYASGSLGKYNDGFIRHKATMKERVKKQQSFLVK